MEEGLIKPINTPSHLYRRRFMEHRLQGRIQEVGKAVKFTVSEGLTGYARVGEAVEGEEGKTGYT